MGVTRAYIIADYAFQEASAKSWNSINAEDKNVSIYEHKYCHYHKTAKTCAI